VQTHLSELVRIVSKFNGERTENEIVCSIYRIINIILNEGKMRIYAGLPFYIVTKLRIVFVINTIK